MAKNGTLTPRNVSTQDLKDREVKANTRQAVASAATNFEALMGKMLPATVEDMEGYLLACVNKGYALATVTTRMALLTTWHDEYLIAHGVDTDTNPCRNPTIVRRIRAVRRTIAAPQDQAVPLYVDQLAACIEALDKQIRDADQIENPKRRKAKQLTAIRDKAMLLVGFWFGLRSESLTAITAGNLSVEKTRTGNQLHIFLPETKNSEEFKRQLDSLDWLCPIPAVIDWQNASQPRPGDPFFVSVNQWGHISPKPIHVDSIIPMLRKVLDLAGIDSEGFTSHSLRRGASIWADSRGASTKDRMDWFNWKDVSSAMKYVNAKPSLPSMLQQQDQPVSEAISVLKAHIMRNRAKFDDSTVLSAIELLDALEPKGKELIEN